MTTAKVSIEPRFVSLACYPMDYVAVLAEQAGLPVDETVAKVLRHNVGMAEFNTEGHCIGIEIA